MTPVDKDLTDDDKPYADTGTKILSLSVAQIKSILNDGGDSIDELTNSFIELAGTFNELVNHKTDIDHTDLKELQQQIEQSIISFQFYDRISQRLEHVANSLQQMGTLIETKDSRYDHQQWQQLNQSIFDKYTMESERQLFSCIEQGMSPDTALQTLSDNDAATANTGDIELF